MRKLFILVFALVATAAMAQVAVPHTFEDGDVISASEMNDNFSEIAGALPEIYIDIADSWSNDTTSESFAQVPGLLRTLDLSATATVTVLANGVGIGSSLDVVVVVDGEIVNPGPPGGGGEQHQWGFGHVNSVAEWNNVVALQSVSLAPGIHTVEIHFKSRGSSVQYHGPVMLTLVTY